MKRIAVSLTFFFICLGGMISPVFAENYPGGAEGIKGASLPPAGFYYRLYTTMYSADEFKDADGDDLAVPGLGDIDVDVFAVAHRFLWMTDKTFLGADIGLNMVVPFISLDYNIDNPAFIPDESKDHGLKLGDIYVDPFMLAWHTERFDVATALGCYIPTGDFDKDKTISSDRDHWSVMYSLGATYYLDQKKTWSLSALGRYEKHFKDESRDITRGDDFHIEWGLGKNVMGLFEVGIAGYTQWQLKDDKGRDVTPQNATNDNLVYAIGPEISAFIPAWKTQISLKVLDEFKVRNRSRGTVGTLVITKIF